MEQNMNQSFISTIISLFKSPVSTVVETSERETMGTTWIKVGIIALTFGIITILSMIVMVFTTINEDTVKFFRTATKEEVSEARSEAFEDMQLFKTFVGTTIAIAISYVIGGTILFFIAKFANGSTSFSQAFSIGANTGILFTLLYSVSVIISFFSYPLSFIVLCVVTLYALLVNSLAIQQTITNNDDDKYALSSFITILVASLIGYAIALTLFEEYIELMLMGF